MTPFPIRTGINTMPYASLSDSDSLTSVSSYLPSARLPGSEHSGLW
jgi:hypothetical protein